MYNFGQFRRNQVAEDNGFITDVTHNLSTLYTSSSLVDSLYFRDIQLTTGNAFESDSTTSYYIRFAVHKTDSVQDIAIKLYNSAKDTVGVVNKEDAYQEFEVIHIDAGEPEDTSIFEFIITPNNVYDALHFVLTRTMEDYEMASEEEKVDGYDIKGRQMNIEIQKFGLVNNIIPRLSIGGKTLLKQIGVQSTPGFGMCINGELIRVGRSGLYEIRNGVEIYSIGFLIDSNTSENNRYFLLDYQY